MSPDKTLVTHARTGAARFLGYEITVHHADHKLTNGRRSVNGKVALRVPRDVITAKSAPFTKLDKPERRPDLLNLTDNQIIGKYGAEWRGYLQYYLLAQDVWRLNRLQWVMLTSMLKTLAGKHRSTVTAMARKHQATTATPHGPRVCFQASVERAGKPPLVARFGGIPSNGRRRRSSTTADPPRSPADAAAANSSPAYAPGGASYASNGPKCKCTRSPSSPTSSRRDGHNRCGRTTWPGCGARP